MLETYAQLVRCAALSSVTPDFDLLVTRLNLPARPWSSDLAAVPVVTLAKALSAGEQLVLSAEAADWILSADRDTSSLGISAELEDLSLQSRQQLTSLLARLAGALAPAFGWMDRHDTYPAGLLGSVDRVEVAWLFRWNHFGPGYLKKFDQQLFLDIPLARTEVTPNWATVEFDEFLTNDQFELVAQFFFERSGQRVKRYSD